MSDDPNWPRASTWLGGPGAEARIGRDADLIVLGLPARKGSISGGRFDLAPHAIREAMRSFSTYDVESGIDVRDLLVDDLGNVPIADHDPFGAWPLIVEHVRKARKQRAGAPFVFLGGDNSVTWPAALAVCDEQTRLDMAERFSDAVEKRKREGRSKGISREEEDLLSRVADAPDWNSFSVLTFDAHHDLRDTKGGLTNGNPVRALLEDGLPGDHIAQIGIQGFANSQTYAEVARDAGIHVVTAERVRAEGMEAVVADALKRLSALSDAIYVDLDVDVLDVAFAPACPGARPGGLNPMELRQAARLCGAHPKVVAVDVVEVDPERDVKEATAMAAASFVLSFAAGLALR